MDETARAAASCAPFVNFAAASSAANGEEFDGARTGNSERSALRERVDDTASRDGHGVAPGECEVICRLNLWREADDHDAGASAVAARAAAAKAVRSGGTNCVRVSAAAAKAALCVVVAVKARGGAAAGVVNALARDVEGESVAAPTGIGQPIGVVEGIALRLDIGVQVESIIDTVAVALGGGRPGTAATAASPEAHRPRTGMANIICGRVCRRTAGNHRSVSVSDRRAAARSASRALRRGVSSRARAAAVCGDGGSVAGDHGVAAIRADCAARANGNGIGAGRDGKCGLVDETARAAARRSLFVDLAAATAAAHGEQFNRAGPRDGERAVFHEGDDRLPAVGEAMGM